jgi:hypothetical protein
MRHPRLPRTPITITSAAEDEIVRHVLAYANFIKTTSQELASSEGESVVKILHVTRAYDIIEAIRQDNSRTKQLAGVIGGALLGTFFQGFVNELAGGRTIVALIYCILGLVGLILLSWALFS